MLVYRAEFPMVQSYLGSHPDQFAGVYVDDASRTLHINLVTAGSSVVAGLASEVAAESSKIESAPARAAGQRYSVVVRAVRYSQRQLVATAAEVTTRQPWASLARPVLSIWGPDPYTDTVTVRLTKLTPALREAAQAAFGGQVTLMQGQRLAAAVRVTELPRKYRVVHISGHTSLIRQSRATPLGVAPQPSRLLDEQAYYGGDRIYRLVTNSNGTTTIYQCTAGFAFAAPAMSTSGHCAPQGAAWTQGYYDKSTNTLYNAGYLGSVFSVQWGDQRIDFELMNNNSPADPSLPPYYPYVYTALQNSVIVGGARTTIPMLFDKVCVDGSFTGENCAGQVTAAGQSAIINLPDGSTLTEWYVDVVSTVFTDNSRLCQAGDSGGPVYGSGSSLLAVGIMSACNEGTPTNPGPGNTAIVSDISTAVPIMNAGPVWTVP
jgi:hypothetical protein